MSESNISTNSQNPPVPGCQRAVPLSTLQCELEKGKRKAAKESRKDTERERGGRGESNGKQRKATQARGRLSFSFLPHIHIHTGLSSIASVRPPSLLVDPSTHPSALELGLFRRSTDSVSFSSSSCHLLLGAEFSAPFLGPDLSLFPRS
jgi:hypothetical protein